MSDKKPDLLPRRQVLKLAGSAIAVAALPAIEGCTADVGDEKQDGPPPGPPEQEIDSGELAGALTVSVLRKQDMAVLDLGNKNQKPAPTSIVLSGDYWLGKTNAAAAAYIVAIFQPQHFLEQTFNEGDPNAVPTVAPVKQMMAQPSRLAFRVPNDLTGIPFE